MPSLPETVPNIDDLLELGPEEIGGKILQSLSQVPERKFHMANFINQLSYPGAAAKYPADERVFRAVAEAWGWLENEGLLAPEPNEFSHGWRFVSRRGQAIKTEADFESYRRASVLPRELIHPRIRDKVWSNFRRGDHDTAVFQAFREVEIAVRDAGGYGPTMGAVAVMDEAFKPHAGLLTDKTRPEAEQLAERRLFAGAIGSYKNPQSHRHVGIPSADEAAEMIVFASHLLRIVDARVSALAAQKAS